MAKVISVSDKYPFWLLIATAVMHLFTFREYNQWPKETSPIDWLNRVCILVLGGGGEETSLHHYTCSQFREDPQPRIPLATSIINTAQFSKYDYKVPGTK